MQALYGWVCAPENLKNVQQSYLDKHGTKSFDTKYFSQLLHGVVDSLEQLDAHISPHTNISIEQVDIIELTALRIATFELLHVPEVPRKVVMNEAIELTKSFGSVDGYKFVNGVVAKIVAQL